MRRQLGILKSFLEEFDFVSMKPDESTVRAVSPELTTTVLSRRGEAYAIYLHVPLSGKPGDLAGVLRDIPEATVKLNLPAAEYSIKWVNPLTGDIAKPESRQHAGGELTLTSPPFSNDIALRVVRSTSRTQ
ncbi:MAG: hypothetical protein R3C19_01840 [Planctomycetaceae bacterium]